MLNIYLAGEIHSDWRDDIIQLTKKNDLNSTLPVLKPVSGLMFSSIQLPSRKSSCPKEDIAVIIKNNTLKIIGFFMPSLSIAL